MRTMRHRPIPDDNATTRTTSPDFLAHARVHTQSHRLRVYARSLACAPRLLLPVGRPMQVQVRVFWQVGYRYGSRRPRVTRALA